MNPYRSLEPVALPTPTSKPLRCYLGLHKLHAFTVTASKRFICVGVKVQFYCACGKHLWTKHKPTNRPVTIVVGADWDGMGGS